jgi:hypothetical protein
MSLRALFVLLALAVPACAGGGTPHGLPSDSGPADGNTSGDAGVSVTIPQVQNPAAAGHVATGTSVRITGAIVSAVDAFEENGAGMGNQGDVWIADAAGGPWSGVEVTMPTIVTCSGHPSLSRGDVVDVVGVVGEYAAASDGSGRTTTVIQAATVTCTLPGTAPMAAAVMDASTLTADASAEQWEGVLVELSMVEASSDPDATNLMTLRVGPAIDDDLYRHPGSRRDTFTTLRGIFTYAPGRWEILPRDAMDIVLGTPRMVENASGSWACADGTDNDGDSTVDCMDADCSTSLFCRGTRVTVQDVQDTTRAMHPAAGSAVALVGPLTVTSIDSFAEMTGSGYVGTVVVQDAAATDARFSGIHVFIPMVEACGGALALGDQVYVAGTYEEYAAMGDTGGTLSEIHNGIVSCRAAGTPIAATPVAMPSDLAAAATAEPWEGVLVSIGGVDVTMPAGMYGRFQVTGGVFVDDDVYRATVMLGDRVASLTGVLTYQFEYQLEPRMASDVVLGPTEHDDASCSNAIDDDGDGAIDCNDTDCCGVSVCMGAVAGRRVILSEVLYDAAGTDSGHEWIEIRNAGATDVPLGCYSIGSGPTSYSYSVAQLPAITIPAGGCLLIGGPDCGGMPCGVTNDFTPDLHNGTAGSASGVALMYSLASRITGATVPVDAVLYGTANTGMLLDASGAAPASANVADVTAGHSIGRAADGSWVDLATPTPGTCTTYTP